MTIRRSVACVVALGALAVAGCHDPLIPRNQYTTRVCWDGTVCPVWQDCPNYATPGRCEMAAPDIEHGAKVPPPDAGPPAPSDEPTDPLLGEPPPGHGGQG